MRLDREAAAKELANYLAIERWSYIHITTDSHTAYQLHSEQGQPNGYPDLDVNGLIPPAQIPSYTHTQASSSAVWDVVHNLGFRPLVQVFDNGGVETLGNIAHIDNNHLTITLTPAMAGVAYLR